MSGSASSNSSALLVCEDNEDVKSFYPEDPALESGHFEAARKSVTWPTPSVRMNLTTEYQII